MQLSKAIVVAVTLAAGMSAMSFAATPADYAEGVKLYQQKNYRAAAAKFEAAMKLSPRDANIIYYCALAHQLSSNRTRARQLYEYIGTIFPGSSLAAQAQTGISQLGGGAGAATPGASSGSSSTGASRSSGGSSSSPAYLAALPDEMRVPLLRRSTMSKAAYLEVQINGRPLIFHLDTGAGSTVIGANHLEQLGLTRPASGDKYNISGVGDREQVKGWDQKIDIKVGNIYRRDFRVAVQDEMQGEPLLGQDFLSDFITSVDDQAGQIIFRKKSAGAGFVSRSAKDIPFRLQGRHLIVDAYVNGKKYEMYFDTGADSVAFSQNDFKKLGIPLPDSPATGRSMGVMGATATWTVTLDSLKVGPIAQENFNVSLLETTKMDHPLLGQSFFGQYKYTVDTKAGVIHLTDQ